MARYAYGDEDEDDDYDWDGPCHFCGHQDCDGTGYNCPDEYYDKYNEGAENYLARVTPGSPEDPWAQQDKGK